MDSTQSKNARRQPAKLPQKLPVKQSDRKSTDWFCTIFGGLFAIAMLSLACIFFNKGDIINVYYPITGANNQPCQLNDYMHMQDPNSFQTRKCISKCPESFSSIDSRLCLPKDQNLKAKYLKNPNFTRAIDNLGFLQTIVYVLIMTIGWGVTRMTISNCFPRQTTILSYATAIVILLAIAIVSFATDIVRSKLGYLVYAFGGSLIVLAFILVVMLCLYSNQVKFQGYMLQYATKFLDQNVHTFLYLPFFIIFHIGFAFLIFFQHFSFSSHQFTTANLWNYNVGQILIMLNIIEYLWGLQFLKDAYNYCVSGNAVDWYWTGKSDCCTPVKRLCKNWGSVTGGSFLNAFFQIPALISQLIVCHPGTCCSRLGICCYTSCDCIGFLFESVRTDAYSYISLTGIPFLKAASQCSKLCEKSKQFVGYHSAMKHHRFSAHVASVSFIFCWAFWILSYRTVNYDLWNVAILIVLIYANISPFIGVHIDAAEGLQTSYLAELELQGEHQYMQKILPSVRKILQPRQNRVLGDGNC